MHDSLKRKLFGKTQATMISRVRGPSDASIVRANDRDKSGGSTAAQTEDREGRRQPRGTSNDFSRFLSPRLQSRPCASIGLTAHRMRYLKRDEFSLNRFGIPK